MCLAVPARIVQLLPEQQAIVEVGGVCSAISLALLDAAEVGDYVIVHVGFAIARLDQEEAQKTLTLFAEMVALAPAGDHEIH